MLFVVLCDCWFRLCCMLYWVQVPHNTCYAMVEREHAVYGCRNGCMCLLWVWGGREIFMITNHNCCIKLVPLIIIIYDARSHIHQVRILYTFHFLSFLPVFTTAASRNILIICTSLLSFNWTIMSPFLQSTDCPSFRCLAPIPGQVEWTLLALPVPQTLTFLSNHISADFTL